MQTIGERLEEARKKKGISIREAAEATKIRGDYLSKFENNQFDINLTELYVRGFLRTYANFLRVPSDRILSDYAALGHSESKPRQPSREIYGRMEVSISSDEDRADKNAIAPESPAPAATVSRRNAGPSRHSSGSGISNLDPALVFKVLKWAGLVVGILVVLWVAKALFSSDGGKIAKSSATTTAAPASTAPAVTQPAATNDTITLVAIDVVRVTVLRKNPDKTDGDIIFQGTLVRGQTQVVPKPGPIYLVVSAAENLEIEVHGKRYPTQQRGYQKLQML